MRSESRLDTYLSEVERGLRMLPPQDREEELREARLHLSSLANSLAEKEAVDPQASAIQQYGTATDVARKIRSAWLRGRGGEFRSAFFYGAGLWNFAFNQCFLSTSLLTRLYDPPTSVWHGFTLECHGTEAPLTLRVAAAAVCLFLAGLLSGRIFRGAPAARGAMWGAVCVLAFQAMDLRAMSFDWGRLVSYDYTVHIGLSLLTAPLFGLCLGSMVKPLSLSATKFGGALIQLVAATAAMSEVTEFVFRALQRHNLLPDLNARMAGTTRWFVVWTLIDAVICIAGGLMVGRRAKTNPTLPTLAASALIGLNYALSWILWTLESLRFWHAYPNVVLRDAQPLEINLLRSVGLTILTAAAATVAFRRIPRRPHPGARV